VDHASTGERAEGLTVTVGTLDDTREGFFVADDGPGIPIEDREVVLERGYSTVDGTGYGLAIVAGLADAHGWTVEATESESGGARLEVRT
jgi:signal transduction histidine kinase